MGLSTKLKDMLWGGESDFDDDTTEGGTGKPDDTVLHAFPGNIAQQGKVYNINTTTQVKVVCLRPERYEEVGPIADKIKQRGTVVLSLERIKDSATARRTLDFLSGAAYAMDGEVKRVSQNVYTITPANVDASGEFLDALESEGLFY
jgi:cell division inhibitor SepF